MPKLGRLAPVIDAPVSGCIQQKITRLNLEAKPLFPPVERAQAASNSIANLVWPQAFEIGSVAELEQKIFGPVLHLLRWRGAQVGNVYINRNQIGAVVGGQPFGGEGLSGTGPKAGGPH